MTTFEIIESDIGMIKCLFEGGMEVASQNLLKQVYEDYSKRVEAEYKKASVYLKDLLYPQVCHQPIKKVSNKEVFFLGIEQIMIPWMEWLSYFPGTSVEAFEDRQNGFPVKWGAKQVDAEWFKAKKTGVFYTPNGFNDSIPEKSKTKRNVNNIRSLQAFFVDVDKAPTAELKAVIIKSISESKLLPSLVVETRNGFHALWLLERGYGAEYINQWKQIQNALIAHFKSDKACSDPSRLLRMPSSWHCKEMWEGGEGFMVKLMFDSKKMYRMEDFSVFGFKTEKKIVRLKNFVPSGKLIEPKIAALGIGDRHAALKQEAGRVYVRIGTDTSKAVEARAIMKKWYQKSCNPLKQEWESEVDKCCDWVEIQQFGQKI